MIASELILTREEAIDLRLTDAYSVHRVVYDLFEDVRSDEDKAQSNPSGILYLDRGIREGARLILILSNRPPKKSFGGILRSRPVPDSFLAHELYRFEVKMNPTKRQKNSGKTIAIRGFEATRAWFLEKASSAWGFQVKEETLVVEISADQKFMKGQNNMVTQASTMFSGELEVIHREKFIHSIQNGIGRGRAFGFGLLQVVPILT